jgi:NAD(P)H-hydrate epimerase
MVLIERAALAVAEELLAGDFDLKKVEVVCGSGNNGGDGIAIARLLYLKNIDVKILYPGDENKCTDETRQLLGIARKYGIPICKDEEFEGCTTIVDALFGIGISRLVEGEFASLIDKMNASGADILSVDIPSGISADTGEVMGTAVRAKMTVTFAYKKLGHVLQPGAEYSGIVKLKDIGITDLSFEGVYPVTTIESLKYSGQC